MNEEISQLIAAGDYSRAEPLILSHLEKAPDLKTQAEWHSFAGIFYRLTKNPDAFLLHSNMAIQKTPFVLEYYTFCASGYLDLYDDVSTANSVLKCAQLVNAKPSSTNGHHRYLVKCAAVAFYMDDDTLGKQLLTVAFSPYFASATTNPDTESVLGIRNFAGRVDIHAFIKALAQFQNVHPSITQRFHDLIKGDM